MKKLLVLILILGMSSLANAAITLDGPTLPINEGDTVLLGINNGDGRDYLAYLSIYYISEGGFSMGAMALAPTAGDMSSIGVPYDYSDIWEVEVTLAQSEGTTTPGIQFTAALTCMKMDVDVYVELWDAANLTQPVDSLTITQVPEPMTIVLLGLGGLALLRRRK